MSSKVVSAGISGMLTGFLTGIIYIYLGIPDLNAYVEIVLGESHIESPFWDLGLTLMTYVKPFLPLLLSINYMVFAVLASYAAYNILKLGGLRYYLVATALFLTPKALGWVSSYLSTGLDATYVMVGPPYLLLIDSAAFLLLHLVLERRFGSVLSSLPIEY